MVRATKRIKVRKMPIQSVIYCHTACGPQEGLDVEAQKQERFCRDYAVAHGCGVIEVFSDSGVSGLSENRSGFNALLDFLHQQRKPFAVLVASRDRLARDLDLLLILERKLSDLCAPLVFVNEVYQKVA